MRTLLICGAAAALAACATPKIPRQMLPAAAQETLLREVAEFRFNGRASALAGTQGFTGASITWRQREAEAQIRISGLFAGSMALVYGPGTLRVTTSRGEELLDDEAAGAIEAQLGFLPPFEALRYWVMGLPAPGEPPVAQTTDEAGRTSRIAQQGWSIGYDRWMVVDTPAGQVRLPQRLVATRDDLKLTVFINRWTLGAAK